MLVLPDTNAFRVDLDQLCKRIHQAAADTDGTTDCHVIFGELVAGDLGCGIDGRSVLADHEHLYFAVVADIGNELFCFTTCRPIPDSDGINSVCGYQLCHFGSRFAFFVLGRVGVDRFVMQQCSLRIEANQLATGTVTGIDPQHAFLPQGWSQ